MPSPFDRFHIDALLRHFVQGRHLAEPGDFADDEVDDVVDFFFSRESSEAEANATVGEFIADSQCSQDIARFQTGAGTGRVGQDSTLNPQSRR